MCHSVIGSTLAVGSSNKTSEATLRGGDLSGAVAELDNLTGVAASAAATWRSDAQARLDADDAINQLEALAIARLLPANGGS